MAEKKLDGTHTNVSMGDSSQIHGTRVNEKISQSHEKVIRPEFAIRDCNTDRGGHPTEVSSSFHDGNIRSEASGDSTGIPVMDSGKLVSADELRLFTQQKNPHREGKQHVQDLGQSSTSNVENFNKKQGKESGKPSIDNSRPTVTPAYNVFANELHRIDNDPSKAWVAKEQGNSGVLRPDPDVTNTDTPIKDQALSKDQQGKLLPDDYGALNTEDEVDPDNQSMDESEEDADNTMKQTGPVFGSNLQDKCSDIQRMTEEHGLSPRGRKQTRQIPHQTITRMSDNSSRPMTRSKSKGY
uniref:Uncharacterized protein n=1 Tax=Solanum tuberosum TaxID=4113 RepID=M1DZ62_SOLTU